MRKFMFRFEDDFTLSVDALLALMTTSAGAAKWRVIEAAGPHQR